MSRPRGEFPSVSSVGAANELRACAELMRHGYHVYRSMSPHAPFDLVAYRDGATERVEVKTLTEPKGTYGPGFAFPKNDEWDLLAVVAEDRIFVFESGVTADQARDAVRSTYGFQASHRNPMAYEPCGTQAAYQRHYRRQEEICVACNGAHEKYLKRYRCQRPDAAPAKQHGQESDMHESAMRGIS